MRALKNSVGSLMRVATVTCFLYQTPVSSQTPMMLTSNHAAVQDMVVANAKDLTVSCTITARERYATQILIVSTNTRERYYLGLMYVPNEKTMGEFKLKYGSSGSPSLQELDVADDILDGNKLALTISIAGQGIKGTVKNLSTDKEYPAIPMGQNPDTTKFAKDNAILRTRLANSN
jgi:hypothetical protein